MATNVSTNATSAMYGAAAPLPAQKSPQPAQQNKSATAVTPADRVALSSSQLTGGLVLGLATAAQLLPGVAEAEAASGAVTAIGIGARALAANKVVATVAGFVAGAGSGYVRSLVHDATVAQPALHGVTDFGNALDGSIRSMFGIPQSDSSR